MIFDARGLSEIAQSLATGLQPADHRSAINRAYYSAFGYAKKRCLEVDTSYRDLALEHFRPGEIAGLISRPLKSRWKALREFREQSDYNLRAVIGSDEVQQALEHASMLIEAFENAPQLHFERIVNSLPSERRISWDASSS